MRKSLRQAAQIPLMVGPPTRSPKIHVWSQHTWPAFVVMAHLLSVPCLHNTYISTQGFEIYACAIQSHTISSAPVVPARMIPGFAILRGRRIAPQLQPLEPSLVPSRLRQGYQDGHTSTQLLVITGIPQRRPSPAIRQRSLVAFPLSQPLSRSQLLSKPLSKYRPRAALRLQARPRHRRHRSHLPRKLPGSLGALSVVSSGRL